MSFASVIASQSKSSARGLRFCRDRCAASLWLFRWRGFGCRSLSEPPIPRDERLQHVRYQRRHIDRFAVGLRVQRRVAVEVEVEVGLEASRARKGARHAATGPVFGSSARGSCKHAS